MAGYLGVFGGLMLLARRTVAKGLDATHGVVQAVPFPTPYVVVHLAVFVGLFLGFFWYWNRTWPGLWAFTG